MAFGFSNRALHLANTTGLGFTTLDYKLALFTPSFVFNPASNFLSAYTANEVTTPGTNGYTRESLTGKTATQDDVLNRGVIDAANIIFANGSWGSTGFGGLFINTGNDTTSEFIYYFSLDPVRDITSGEYTFSFANAGAWFTRNA